MSAPSPSTPAGTGTETGFPVPGRPIIRFTWNTGAWLDVFDRHVQLIKSDLARAHAEGRIVVYLSCPISSRGGGHFGTNVDIANDTARWLSQTWGERFFVLNPTAYQLESKEGTGLISRHLEALRGTYPGLTLEKLLALARPAGGDYMRMWSRVLIEDDYIAARRRRGRDLGGAFDAYYFQGPTDVRRFFAHASSGQSLSGQMEEYFARKYTTSREFYLDFATADTDHDRQHLLDLTRVEDATAYEARRRAFFTYYSVRASAAFSLGSHDEWNTLFRLNQARRADPDYGPGEEIAAFFDGRQLTLGDTEQPTVPGYGKTGEPPGVRAGRAEVAWPYGAVPAPASQSGSAGA
ncbi:hypothetical protein [Goodfellowiella coeruleoviolacea]|uniref:Uncharacterized protein n=1 Tax=Goodfellowiella coeruleoviolacea TaxID=334858 RepID=A0AAE3KEH7_9PSEU|nr:hypothetical protein [Goodfellowiella coeruleoviolacea]MCP2163384.1 hypothetical protein [Goodfellowiella coeruleoviolacea]